MLKYSIIEPAAIIIIKNEIGDEIMAALIIGSVKSGKRKSYEVKWDQSSKVLYVNNYGWTNIGKASSAGETMTKAEAWAYNK